MAERNMVNLTITISKEERKAIKQIALDTDMTVSALIRSWLQEHQKEVEKRMVKSIRAIYKSCNRECYSHKR